MSRIEKCKSAEVFKIEKASIFKEGFCDSNGMFLYYRPPPLCTCKLCTAQAIEKLESDINYKCFNAVVCSVTGYNRMLIEVRIQGIRYGNFCRRKPSDASAALLSAGSNQKVFVTTA